MDREKELRKLTGCTGKARHASFAAAQKHQQQGKRTSKGIVKSMKIHVYHCPFCGGYHVGHENPKLKNRN